jgi:hypothetical protein
MAKINNKKNIYGYVFNVDTFEDYNDSTSNIQTKIIIYTLKQISLWWGGLKGCQSDAVLCSA